MSIHVRLTRVADDELIEIVDQLNNQKEKGGGGGGDSNKLEYRICQLMPRKETT